MPGFTISHVVLAIGSAARSVSAAKDLLSQVKAADSISVLIVQTSDEAAEALSVQAIREIAKVPVAELKTGYALAKNCIYLVPPNTLVSFENGLAKLNRAENADKRASLVDSLFFAVASQFGESAVAVILSSTSSDGVAGIQKINSSGGLTIAQSPSLSDQKSMADHAISTGKIDHVLNPKDIWREVHSYAEYLEQVGSARDRASLQDQLASSMTEIFALLQSRTKHDFKHYKTSTLLRRIQRRIQVLQLVSVSDYVKRLSENAVEVDTLFSELLINVTSFFRDKEAFETLKEDVLSLLVKNSTSDRKIRIWVAGCSTGEEPYSLAIMLREIIETTPNPPEIQIIATDIDDAALKIARRGSYPSAISHHVSAERLSKYFVKRNGRYHVRKEVREMCLFSVHNLITDPPFSQLDLITCRNVLIYLGSHLQFKLFPVFHYALKPDGYLFLGTSEALTSHRELFKALSAKHRIAQRKQSAIKLPAINTSVQNYLSHFHENDKVAQEDLNLIGQRIALDEMPLRYVIVNDDGQILSNSASIDKFIQLPEGAFQNNIVKLVAPSLRAALRTAFGAAKKQKRKIVNDGCALHGNDGVERIAVIVQPMPQLGDLSGLYWIAFQSLGKLPVKDVKPTRSSNDGDAELIEQLERELAVVRQELEKSFRDLEASNEELKSSNEELLSMNEELQSANEELETSKEDVQSSNDALQRSNSDLENLLASTQIATLFLDDDQRIRGFTPAIQELYNVQAGDVGRKLSDFTSRARVMPGYPENSFFVDQQMHESETLLPDGRVFLRRIVPYRSRDGRKDGVVVNFIEVTDLRSSEGRFLKFANSAPIISWMTNRDGQVEFFNSRWFEYTGQNFDASQGWGWQSVLHPDDAERALQSWSHSLTTGEDYKVEYRLRRNDGEYRWHEASGIAYRNESGGITNWFGTCVDIHEQKEQVDLLLKSGQSLKTIVEAIPQLIWRANVDGSIDYVSERFVEFVQYDRGRMTGWGWTEIIHPEDRQKTIDAWAKARALQASFSVDFKIKIGLTDEYRWIRSEASPHFDESGNIRKYYGTWTDIHERILAEEARKASEQRFKAVVNSAPVLVWIAGKNEARTWFNDAWLEFTGEEMKASTGHGWMRKVHSEDLEKYLETYKRHFETQTPFQLEYRLRFHDGSYRWISARGVPIFKDSGEFDGFIGACLDIHETKRLTEAVKTSEAHFRTLVDKSPAVMWITNKDAECTYLSQQWYEITGRTPELDLGFGWVENCHPDDKESAAKAFFSAIESKEKISIRYRLRQRDGTYRWAVDSGLPLRADDGEFLGYIGTVIDIDDQVQSEEQFADLRDRFSRSVEATDLGVWYCDLPFDELIWSKEVKKHFFLDADAFVTMDTFYAHIHVDDRDRTRAAIEHSIENHSPYDIRYRTIDPKDVSKLNWIRAIGWTDYDKSGKPIRFDGITLNVTREHRAQQELRQAKQEAENASESKTRFLANMSHEIRTPLSAIIGFGDLLRAHVNQDVEANEFIERIFRNATLLSRLIDDLLDLSKIEADKIEIEIADVEIDSLIEDVFSTMSLRADMKGVRIDLNWRTPKPNRIQTDSVRFGQILTNVIGNAIKFTEKGTVKVDLAVEDSRLIVRVEDTGIGLTSQQQARIFEPFMQADASVTRKYGGTGLGLALSKRLAKHLGGDLSLDRSLPGEGSVFKIEIPLSLRTTNAEAYTPRIERPTVDSAESLRGVSVLVVDDSADNRIIVGMYLKAAGASVKEASDGQQGLSAALSENFDVVLMDIQMPVMDGHQALAGLRHASYRKPVIALTAHAFKEERDRCLQAGFTSYITKPINKLNLINCIFEIVSAEREKS